MNMVAETSVQTKLASDLAKFLGDKGWLQDSEAIEPYVTEWRNMWRGACIGVARPTSTQEVASVVQMCGRVGIAITPQGGNTGLVGGGVPNGGIVLSTSRLNKIRDFDGVNQTITVEAGCILSAIQTRALEDGLMFPLSLGAEGTCQIGGNLSTNAGGVGVLRYGNARDLMLGLEVVLPNGEILNNINGLRKNNTGYELNHLFMGAEGTLGIITAATLKLYPAPKSRQTSLVAMPNVDAALDVFVRLRAMAGHCLTAFEIINRQALELVERHVSDTVCKFEHEHPYYALVELSSPRQGDQLREIMENCLGASLEAGTASDALLAESDTQAEMFWRLRETIPEAQVLAGASVKHDISVPVSAIPSLVKNASEAVKEILPSVRIVAFGHMGDGNLHFNLSQPGNMDGEKFLEMWRTFNDAVHGIAVALDGSFSAEHGIGTLKRSDLAQYRSPAAVNLMRLLKSSIDPDDLMNPGKVIPD